MLIRLPGVDVTERRIGTEQRLGCNAVARSSYLDHLASIPLFAECDRKELEEIGRLADEIQIEAGREFIRQGDIGREMMLIVEGTAVVHRDGHEVATLGPGEFVGELAALTSHPRTASVLAKTTLDVLVIDQRVMDSLLEDIPGLARSLLKAVVGRLVDSGF